MADPTDADLPDNWGRWGADDELGTLNLITDDVRAKAAAEVRTGRWVSLALPITPNPMVSSPFAPTTVDVSPVQHMMSYTGMDVAADLMLVTNHSPKSTHIDALSHRSRDGKVYPGKPRAEAVTANGVTHGSTGAFAAGIVTRGVLLDLAVDGPLPSGYAVTSQDFERAEQRQGVEVVSGDALVLRLGWPSTPVPARRRRVSASRRCAGCTVEGCRCAPATGATRIRHWTLADRPHCTESGWAGWRCH